MKRRILGVVALIVLSLAAFGFAIGVGRAQLAQIPDIQLTEPSTPATLLKPQPAEEPISTACAIQPEKKPKLQSAVTKIATGAISLSRFRPDSSLESATNQSPLNGMANQLFATKPPEEIALIHPTNYGDRYLKDLYGKPALLDPIIVLHETVGSANSVINFFRTPHPRDEDQVSYHTLIRRDGTITYMVPPDKRAFGAGNSAFKGSKGLERIRTKPDFPGSVNNFAYHISLESPVDGYGGGSTHSGYTDAQYQSLAWLVAKTGVPDGRITTHREVDRSASRIDPRSFRRSRFLAILNTLPRTTEISIRCTEPPGWDTINGTNPSPKAKRGKH